MSPDRVIEVFTRYMHEEGAKVTRAMLEQNLSAKKADRTFTADMSPLLANGQTWSFEDAFALVWRELIGRLPGDPWKGS